MTLIQPLPHAGGYQRAGRYEHPDDDRRTERNESGHPERNRDLLAGIRMYNRLRIGRTNYHGAPDAVAVEM